jgi:hypothetical protein
MTFQEFASHEMPRAGSGRIAGKSEPAACRELTEAEISSLVEDIERSGYAVLPQYVTTEDLNHLQHFVRDAVAAGGNGYTMLDGYAPVANTVLGRIADSAAETDLHARLRTGDVKAGARTGLLSNPSLPDRRDKP